MLNFNYAIDPLAQENENRYTNHMHRQGKKPGWQGLAGHIAAESKRLRKQQTESEYTKQANDLLTELGAVIDFKQGPTLLDAFGDGDKMRRTRYTVTITRGKRSETFDFTTSAADTFYNVPPTAYDFLSCVQKHETGTHADFCSDFGYDTDSRKALDIYLAVQEEYNKMRRLFSAAELEKLNVIS